jgi:hypothetical protein
MATFQVNGIEDLGPEIARLLNRAVPALAVALRHEITEALLFEVQDRSPVDTGRYRAAHTPSAGEIKTTRAANLPSYPTPGSPEVEAALQGSPAGESAFVANAAADERYPDSGYAGLLEGGRRQYSRRSTGKTQWIGSNQAPEGIYGPSVQALKGKSATIEEAAVARARESIRGGR